MTLLIKIGTVIILIGVAPLLYTLFLRYSHNWEPLTVSLQLRPGEFQSDEFKTDLDGRYLVALRFDKLQGQDFDRAQCMMGIDLPANVLSCSGTQKTIDFVWEVVGDKGFVMGSGSYKPLGFGGNEVQFGAFHGRRGSQQRLVLKIMRDAGRLNDAHPKLVVQAGPEYSERLPFLHYYSMLWLEVIGSLGVLCVLIAALTTKTKARATRPPNPINGG